MPAASSVPATRTEPRARLATHFTLLSFEAPRRIRGGGGGGAGIVTVAGAERPPPLGDVNTVTVAVPGRATSAAVRRAVRRPGDTQVVGRSAPFQRTTDRNANPRPSTVSVAPGAPATSACGKPVIVGTAPIGCQSGEKSSVTGVDSCVLDAAPPAGNVKRWEAGPANPLRWKMIRVPSGEKTGRVAGSPLRSGVPPEPSLFTTWSRSMSVRRTRIFVPSGDTSGWAASLRNGARPAPVAPTLESPPVELSSKMTLAPSPVKTGSF